MRTAALAILALLAAGCGAREDPRGARIDALLRAYTGSVPGAAVLVLEDGVPVFRRAYGLADLERRTPVTAATDFRLASMTKQFTAAAILLLAQDRRLTLDDPVRRWLPSLPPAAEPVTLRQLLTHTAGLIDYEDLIPADATRQVHDADVLAMLERENRTYFPPGSRYRYSDTGYALLALVVERASGRDFASFLRARIFIPLGMYSSLAYQAGVSRVPRRAFGYSASGSAWKRTDQSLTSAVLGDGGVYSSIDDLAKWDAALYDTRLLARESLEAAFTPGTDSDDPAVRYGFGWRISGETLWHSGETVGFRNVIVRWPARHFTVIVLTNRDQPAPYALALAIAKLYFPQADAGHAAGSAAGPDPSARPLPAH